MKAPPGPPLIVSLNASPSVLQQPLPLRAPSTATPLQLMPPRSMSLDATPDRSVAPTSGTSTPCSVTPSSMSILYRASTVVDKTGSSFCSIMPYGGSPAIVEEPRTRLMEPPVRCGPLSGREVVVAAVESLQLSVGGVDLTPRVKAAIQALRAAATAPSLEAPVVKHVRCSCILLLNLTSICIFSSPRQSLLPAW